MCEFNTHSAEIVNLRKQWEHILVWNLLTTHDKPLGVGHSNNINNLLHAWLQIKSDLKLPSSLQACSTKPRLQRHMQQAEILLIIMKCRWQWEGKHVSCNTCHILHFKDNKMHYEWWYMVDINVCLLKWRMRRHDEVTSAHTDISFLWINKTQSCIILRCRWERRSTDSDGKKASCRFQSLKV